MEISESIQLMKALADTSRLGIINALLEKPHYVEEIAERFGLAVSTVSFHLKKLEQAGLVSRKKEQYYVTFFVNDAVFNIPLRELVRFENPEKLVQKTRIDNYKQKVKNSYFKNGKLTHLPKQHKKRWIVLEEIINEFEAGKIYTEKAVNAIITRFYDDYCTIRRHLVEDNILQRSHTEYWLNPNLFSETAEFGLRKSFLDSIAKK